MIHVPYCLLTLEAPPELLVRRICFNILTLFFYLITKHNRTDTSYGASDWVYGAPPHYIQPSALVEILRNPHASGKRHAIIDVRDTDFTGGHIRSAVNIPEDNFMDDDNVDALVDKYKEEDIIVFHCMMSQVRGPSCAKRFNTRMEVLLEDEHKPQVLILHGGYERFSSIYKDEIDLIEMDD